MAGPQLTDAPPRPASAVDPFEQTIEQVLPAASRRSLWQQASSALRTHRLKAVAFAAMAGLYFFVCFFRGAVPGTIFNELQAGMSQVTGRSVSAAAITGIGAVFLYVYAGMQLVTGMLADRYGGMRVLLVGGLLMCVGSLLFPWSFSLGALYASRVLVGIGASLIYLCAVKEIDGMFGRQHFVHLLGLMICLGSLGGLFGTWPFERTVAWLGWQWALFSFALICSAVWVVTWRVSRRVREMAVPGRPFAWRPMWAVIVNRRSAGLMIGGGCSFSLFYLVQTALGKKFLEDTLELSSSAAAVYTFVTMGVAILATGLAGPMVQWSGNRRKLLFILGQTTCLIGCGLLLLGLWLASPWVHLTAFCLLGAATGTLPIKAAMVKDLNDPRYVGISVAVTNAVTYVFVAVAANLSGLVLDRYVSLAEITDQGIIYPPYAYASLFIGMVVLAMLGLIGVLLSPEPGASTPPH